MESRRVAAKFVRQARPFEYLDKPQREVNARRIGPGHKQTHAEHDDFCVGESARGILLCQHIDQSARGARVPRTNHLTFEVFARLDSRLSDLVVVVGRR